MTTAAPSVVLDDRLGYTLLQGVVGSTAYGLAGPDSDVDRMGLYAWPTDRLFDLRQPAEYHRAAGCDAIWYEARKYVGLALNGNPTVSELMWLPEYEITSLFGAELIAIRSAFLTAHRVRRAYMGYATEQFGKLRRRGDGSFSSDTRKRTAKHARHLRRLLHQGFRLYASGVLPIRLDNPGLFRDFGDRVAAGDLALAERTMRCYELAFDRVRPALPDRPDTDKVQAWLRQVRAEYLSPTWASSK